MHLQKSSRFGLYAVVMMAAAPDRLVTARMVAEAHEIPENHVAKVLQQLARARLLRSVRGIGGGYQLTVAAKDLTMLDVVRVLEGELTPTCFGCDAVGPERHPDCSVYETCPLRPVMEEVATSTYYTLRSVTIGTLAKGARPPAHKRP